MNSFFASLLVLDLDVFRDALSIVPSRYASLVHIAWELVVFFGAFFLVWLWLYGVRKKDTSLKVVALSIAFTIAFTFVAYAIVNLGIPAFRPGAMTISGASALIPHPTDNSFPSGHALFVGAMLVGLWRYYRRSWAFTLTILLAVVTLVARVVGGVHYPWDIIGGLVIGGLVAIFMKPLIDWTVKKTAPVFLKIASWIRL